MGITPLEKMQQIESLDEESRNQIWSSIYQQVLYGINNYGIYSRLHAPYKVICEKIWREHLKLPALIGINTKTNYPTIYCTEFQKRITKGEWYEALDFLEYSLQFDKEGLLAKESNKIFELENIGYRIIDRAITPITDHLEIRSITDALQSPYSNINEHIDKALKLLSDKKSPDYRNSIKESISAVEAICKIIANDEKATLGKALAKIASKHPIPGSLKSALDALYGYTSNEGGIRHALTEDGVTPTFADAKFMLVSCTAFVNYLLTIAAEENISFDTSQAQ